MIKLGSHISFKKPNYLEGAIEESLENGANCAMIYLGAPQSTLRTDVSNYKLLEYTQNYKDKISPEDIIIHAPYIVNPSSETKAEFAIKFLKNEIDRMNYFGAKYLVLHPGAYTQFTRESALEQLIKTLNTVLNETKNVYIVLETMSGKGTEVGVNFEDLVYVLNKVESDRKGLCLDTCHIWDAGYNLHNYDEFIDVFKKTGAYDYLKVIHLNDSKNALFSKKDRHENIGKGFIGKETLKKIVHDPLFDNIPIILETPWVDNKPIYKEEIKMLLEK